MANTLVNGHIAILSITYNSCNKTLCSVLLTDKLYKFAINYIIELYFKIRCMCIIINDKLNILHNFDFIC